MKFTKCIPLIVLSLTTHSLYANTDRDRSYQSTTELNQDVDHVRSTQHYVPQPLLPAKAIQAKSILKPVISAKTTTFVQPTAITSAATDNSGCSAAVFTGLSGTALLDALRNNGRDCIDTLFNDRPETLALGAYSDANLATVINEIKAQALIYNGTDTDNYISAMFYWLKAYAYYDNRRFVTVASQQAMEEAINALYANNHFFDKTKENAAVVRNAMGILKNAVIAERFIHIARDLLSRYDESFENISDWGSAATPLFWQALQSCSRSANCRSEEHNLALINSITSFIDNNLDWLAKSDNDYHLFNLGYQLVNIYEGQDEAHFSAIEAELELQINKVFNTLGPLKTDKGRTLYLAVLESVNYNNVCSTYNVCDKKNDIIAAVLNNRMTCPSGTLFIWAQDMDQAQLEWTCNSLGAHESYFHETLQTNQIPVTPDDNDKLHMVIFNDKKEWVTYGGALFNVSTSNGGTYREGDPSNGTPEATFYAYEYVDERPIFDVWNLRHEYIHYLEGRFISKGDFGDSDSAGRTVWFGEGIAEYISLRDCNAGAIAEARAGEYKLSTIFSNEYGVGQTRIYDWGYLANRFMFERQNATFFSMLALFKQGNFQDYRSQLVDPWINNETFDAEFTTWLTTVDSTGCTTDTTRPPSPVEPIDIDEIQGSDQTGIDACALGRTPEDRNITAGNAICLTDTSNNNQVQLGLSVPSGLVDVSLEITLRHGTGNADLLHRWNNRPNSTTFDNIANGEGNDETIIITPVVAGWNYIHVRADSEFSGVTLLARYVQNDASVADNVLEKGISKIASGNKNESVRFTMEVPADVNLLTFNIFGGTGDADLYVKYGAAPSKNDYDCHPNKNGNVEQCALENIQAGTYHVMLFGYNDFSDVSLVGNYTVGASNIAPIAIITAPLSAVMNSSVMLSGTGSSDSDGTIVSQSWDFGDGSSSTSANASHVYAAAGTYSITLTVTDNDGAEHSKTEQIIITPVGDMDGDGDIDNNDIRALSLAIRQGEVLDPSFDINNDGIIDSNDARALRDLCTYYRCSSTKPEPQAPIAIAMASEGSVQTNMNIEFTSNNSTDLDGEIVAYRWDFGDGSISNLANPTHQYAQPGNYDVVLTITDNDDMIADSTIQIIVNDNSAALQNGVIKKVSGITGGETIYMMTVPSGATNLSFSTSGGTGDSDMHVKFGGEATKADYDCRPWKVGSNEVCNINNVQAGTYYIMLLGYNDFTDVNLLGTYTP